MLKYQGCRLDAHGSKKKKEKGKDTSEKKDLRAIQSNVGKDLFFFSLASSLSQATKTDTKKKRESCSDNMKKQNEELRRDPRKKN